MISKELFIEKYDWTLYIHYAVTCYHKQIIMNELMDVNAPIHLMGRVEKNIDKCDMNTGFTYSNCKQRETVTVIGLHSSCAQFLNSLEHELRHLVDDIAKTYDLDMGGEDVAYLTGDINEMIIEDVQQFICDCKCHHGKKKCKCHDRRKLL